VPLEEGSLAALGGIPGEAAVSLVAERSASPLFELTGGPCPFVWARAMLPEGMDPSTSPIRTAAEWMVICSLFCYSQVTPDTFLHAAGQTVLSRLPGRLRWRQAEGLRHVWQAECRDSIMSPAKHSTALQVDFVRTELETGHRMLALAARQRDLQEDDAAVESLGMARLSLSGAENHLAAVNLPRQEAKQIVREVGELRRRLEAFDGGRTGRARGAS
jgi:hypothetical protein